MYHKVINRLYTYDKSYYKDKTCLGMLPKKEFKTQNNINAKSNRQMKLVVTMSGLYMIVLFIIFYTIVIVGFNALVHCVDGNVVQVNNRGCGKAG